MRLRKSAVVVILALGIVGGILLMSEGVPSRPVPVDHAHLFQEVMTHVAQGYIDSTDGNQLYGLAVQGVLRKLGDAHAAYIPADRLSILRGGARASGQADPGLDIDERDGWVVVVAAYDGSPAARAGLRTGDRIIHVNGNRTYGMSAEEVRQAIQGRRGSQVELAVVRAGVADQLSFTLVREAAPAKAVRAAFMLTSDVAYVRLDRFSRETASALATAIDAFNPERVLSLVLDLRGNPGGLPEEGMAVADLFLPLGSALASARGRSEEDVQEFSDRSAPRWGNLELIVLVDEGTANASEVAAGALQDLDRALVVGRHTFGRGSRQELIPLSNGGAVMLTTARWYTPLGRRIETDAAPPRPPRGTVIRSLDELRPEHKTSSGRTLLGGGGIRPDVVVRRGNGDAGGRLPMELYQRASADDLVRRDAVLRVAVELAGQASGQVDLLARAHAADSLTGVDGDAGGGGSGRQ